MCFSARQSIFQLVLYQNFYTITVIYQHIFALIGAITVISLMTGHVVDRISVKLALNTFTGNATLQTATIGTINQSHAITVAITLAFTVGLIQVCKCIEIYRKNC